MLGTEYCYLQVLTCFSEGMCLDSGIIYITRYDRAQTSKCLRCGPRVVPKITTVEVDVERKPSWTPFEFNSLPSVCHQFRCLFLRHHQMAQVVMRMSSPLSGTEISMRFIYVNDRPIHPTPWPRLSQPARGAKQPFLNLLWKLVHLNAPTFLVAHIIP